MNITVFFIMSSDKWKLGMTTNANFHQQYLHKVLKNRRVSLSRRGKENKTQHRNTKYARTHKLTRQSNVNAKRKRCYYSLLFFIFTRVTVQMRTLIGRSHTGSHQMLKTIKRVRKGEARSVWAERDGQNEPLDYESLELSPQLHLDTHKHSRTHTSNSSRHKAQSIFTLILQKPQQSRHLSSRVSHRRSSSESLIHQGIRKALRVWQGQTISPGTGEYLANPLANRCDPFSQ